MRKKVYKTIVLWYCCNLSVDVVVNVRFTTNEMCAKNNTHIYMGEQTIIE